MKTIRHNCFETNSSSTHSVTITSKSTLNKDVVKLYEDGILYPGRLSKTIAAHDTQGGDGFLIKSETAQEKAASFLHHMKALSSSWALEYIDISAERAKELYQFTEKQICESVPLIRKVAWEGCDWPMDSFEGEEYEDNYISEFFNDYMTPEQAIMNHICDVILNGDIVVLDESRAW